MAESSEGIAIIAAGIGCAFLSMVATIVVAAMWIGKHWL